MIKPEDEVKDSQKEQLAMLKLERHINYTQKRKYLQDEESIPVSNGLGG
ncbi:hypothetical protein CE91St43_22820 [Oscillospiraceae bacterium]|nr:hypothetical protein CE91St43_22820 [Oscillospiraceae bacterium]